MIQTIPNHHPVTYNTIAEPKSPSLPYNAITTPHHHHLQAFPAPNAVVSPANPQPEHGTCRPQTSPSMPVTPNTETPPAHTQNGQASPVPIIGPYQNDTNSRPYSSQKLCPAPPITLPRNIVKPEHTTQHHGLQSPAEQIPNTTKITLPRPLSKSPISAHSQGR